MALGVAEQYAREKMSRTALGFFKKRDPAIAGGVTFGCPRELISLGENVPGVEVLPCRPTDDTAATPGAFDRITFGMLWDIADEKSCFLYEAALQPHVDRNRPEIWAQKLGLKGRVRPRLYLTDQEREWGRRWVAEKGLQGRFLLGIVHKSTSWGRDWREWVKCIYVVKKRHPLVTPVFFAVGVRSWEEIELATVGIPVVRRPIREMLTILDRCHLVAGVDTGPMHAAAALGRPTLWVFTHIDGRIRTRGYKRARVIQRTDLECNPCWYEARCAPPRHMLCKGIPVGKVARRIERYYKGWRLRTLCSLSASRTEVFLRKLTLATGTTSPKTAL